MSDIYQRRQTQGSSKAEVLSQAQLAFLTQSK